MTPIDPFDPSGGAYQKAVGTSSFCPCGCVCTGCMCICSGKILPTIDVSMDETQYDPQRWDERGLVWAVNG